MAVTTPLGGVGYSTGGFNTDTKNFTLPTGILDGDVLDLQVNLASGSADRLDSVLRINGVTVDATTRRWAAQFSGFTSLLYSVPLTAASSGTQVSFTTGGAATRSPTMTGTILRGSTGAPVATPTHKAFTSLGTTTVTTPAQSAGQADVVEVSFVQDVESTAPAAGEVLVVTTSYTPPAGITQVDARFSTSTTVPVPSCAVGVDLAPKALGASMGGRAWTKNNGAHAGGWTVQHGVIPTKAAVGPSSVVAVPFNDATARVTHTMPVPASATTGRRLLLSFTLPSGQRVLTATLLHADATTRALTELAPKAALTNGGHAHHVLDVACDSKTAGATVQLEQHYADGVTPDAQIKASIILAVVEGVGPAVGVTSPANTSTTSKFSPTLTPPAADYVEVTLASTSNSGIAPVVGPAVWTPPPDFTLLTADFQAGSTSNPVSTSALAARFGTRLSTSEQAGGRQWTSDQPAKGASWTVLYPALNSGGGSGALVVGSGLFAVVEGGYVPLEVVFA